MRFLRHAFFGLIVGLLAPLFNNLIASGDAQSATHQKIESDCPVCCANKIQNELTRPNFEKEIAKSLSCDTPKDSAECKPEKHFLSFTMGDSSFEFSNRLRIEGLYGVNLQAINNQNNDGKVQLDKITWPGRHTLDSWFLYGYGKASHDIELVKFRIGIRNRGMWGDEESIFSTSKSLVNHVDARIGEHSHAITRHVFWARELWLEIALNDLFHTCNRHTFTAGLFPFSLGRGIALGDAYDIDAEFLGDFSPQAIDQYAPGFKLSGILIAPCVLGYDLYAEITGNQSSSFAQVNDPINAQRYNRSKNPARGFGAVSYMLAGRLLWKPYDEKCKRLSLEPYGLFVHTAEQKITFAGDAKSNLGTFGLACEFEANNWEGGFDTAFNIGKQEVYGWDNNQIIEKNNEGVDNFVFDKVAVGSATGPNALANKANKTCVNGSLNQGEKYNRQPITGTSCNNLYNSLTRFSDPCENSIRGGAMFICDLAYTIKPCDLKIAWTAGLATGDEDPNRSLKRSDVSAGNKTFKGFVPQQDLYSGKRVKSILFLASQGRIPRPLSTPDLTDPEVGEEYPTSISRFTDIILTGAALRIKPCIGSREWNISTNVLGFWAYLPVTVPANVIKRILQSPEFAKNFPNLKDYTTESDAFTSGRYFGTEWNVIFETELFKDLKLIAQGSMFFPGSFYRSIKGVPYNLKNILKNSDTRVARLGDSIAYYVNMALEYKF